ncbi:membrane protein [Alkalihalobacillus alcalophilus ATCC 27647 = CGMCC 1.3604]|uniref:Membrane protein n=1 Tax=Alkalihalobacillus alcalophilus ATCC 27647 = CGMCC 1.3604 TaxID=1218173 RepID=A0A094WI80_ALKAL|nr:divergent PAP2 family protein [Alkalihalobacillus alcalophilus]KGA95608.1 membrane protein [Alkalihalobacillus alcalophilus ATCC 27647 = CGMCC 1.3604]MED1563683.1 divergent PAP2 family protein [Alkalihalobacillus alcalophilus]THG90033.1 membrane protein [Alkalihalobacillus alcalophilus ATCC 27647 = CGMCC 1.3604]
MEILQNFPLWAALFAIFFAQFIKIPLAFIPTRKFDWTLFTSTGGMPSSHSAAVTAVTTAVALEYGLDSTLFAVCAIFGIIVMFDATGIRRHAGYHATVLNQLVTDFNKLVGEVKNWPQKEEEEKRKELKELLGHQPIEVFFGGLLGISLTLLLNFLIH